MAVSSQAVSSQASSHIETTKLQQLAKQIRRWIVQSTSEADSGHPTSSLSAVELMTDLVFSGTFRYDVENPEHPANDRLIFSKGHASPLFYALWAAAGQVSEQELMSYRTFGSKLEGHPTARFRFTEAATGSLGQGLSVGLGMALAGKYLDHASYRTFVLLGDSEMAEGSQWEAIQLAAHYKLNNLIAILDVNRLGQRGPTMYGYDLEAYQQRIEAFGWKCILVDDGHDHSQIRNAYADACQSTDQPVMIIARTIKGKGVSFLENQEGFHGKPVDKDRVDEALSDIGEIDEPVHGEIAKPKEMQLKPLESDEAEKPQYKIGDEIATRDAYGNALCRLAMTYPELIALDGEVCNSTRSKQFRDDYPDRFFEMFIAEQNMVGAATGLALRGKLPFVSTFAAFLTRSFDQIRMTPYSNANVKFVGSHCGVSIGQDGPSQMGLEDIAMFRTIQDGVVLYPCDAISTEALVEAMAEHPGIAYLRTTRGDTPVIYDIDETFPIGGSKVLRHSDEDQVTLIAAGITLHEALRAHQQLKEHGIAARVIDLYCIKPLDHATVRQAADQTKVIFTIEDHFPEGGIGEAVLTSLSDHATPVNCLAVRKQPLSGSPDKQLDMQGISAAAIVDAVQRFVNHDSGASA
ncbi:transketolase isoform 1 [Rhodopirellula maiorica SM1]|uniref:Transketolase n=1 Tax=Rhodopirellula maiorica SM1 TaxID=1265738 RepID=M5RCP9_9BACT|nr:transketolase [Rhodopirellula maiorica]EMI16826.1 transketolase isoform 1 [Rhodopirellula maiorica SM1]